MWQTEYTVGTLNANMTNKIMIKKTHKHPHQLLILKINLSILTK